MQPTIDYEDFELQIGPRASTGWHVRVRSPAGQGRAVIPEITLPRLRHVASLGGAAEGPQADVGQRLFQAVFTAQVRDLFYQSLSRVRDDRGLRIRLWIDLHDPEAVALSDLPWELLQRDGTHDFLALSQLTPIVRDIPLPRPAQWTSLKPPLRVLVVAAQASGFGELDLAAELAKLGASDVLRNPDTQSLREAFSRTPFNVLHYMGHGVFDPESGEGALLVPRRDDAGSTISGQHLAIKLNDFPSLRLVVLNACDTARSASASGDALFGGVAASLLRGGVPTVVAMQRPIWDADAVAFSGAFYKQLAAGRSLEQAMTEGRQAILSRNPKEVDWATPVLFMRAGEMERPVKGWSLQKKALVGFSALTVTLSIVTGLAILPGGQGESAIEDEPKGQETPAVEREPEEPKPGTTVPGGKLSPAPVPPVPRLTTFVISDVRFEIAATDVAISSTLDASFHELSASIGELAEAGLAGATVRLDVGASQLTPDDRATCRLTSTCRLRHAGTAIDLRPARATRAHDNGSAACNAAAAELANVVVRELARHLQGGMT